MSSKKSGSNASGGFLFKAQAFLLGLGLLYGVGVVLVMTPLIQTHVIYAHRIDWFGYNRFDRPESYGLAPGKTVNLKLHSSDNVTIGAWFIFSDKFYQGLPFPPSNVSRKHDIPAAARSKPTILFLHGNTGTRALQLRINVYTALTARLDANILAIDYRGFADSEGEPTVDGVSRDAKAGWDYLIEQGTKPEDILIVGHSLGTAIASLLGAQLGREGITPRGLALMSPFSSVRLLMSQYHLFGFLPLLKPLAMLPIVPRVLTWSIAHNFDTLTLAPEIKCSVLVAHAEDDWDIHHDHSTVIYNALLDAYLPPSPTVHNPLLMSHSDWDEIISQQALRAKARSQLVSRLKIENFGALETFKAADRTVSLLKTTDGGHDLPRLEGLQYIIGKTFNLLD